MGNRENGGKGCETRSQHRQQVRGRYARMVGKPLISKVSINRNIQRIEYESLPVVCFFCGCYGHFKENCRRLEEASTDLARHCPWDLMCSCELCNELSFDEWVARMDNEAYKSHKKKSHKKSHKVEQQSSPPPPPPKKDPQDQQKCNPLSNFLKDYNQKMLPKISVLQEPEDSPTKESSSSESTLEDSESSDVNFDLQVMATGDIESGVKENMQYGNLNGVKVHFNPAFEGTDRVEVLMIDGVLNLKKGILIKRTIETLGVGISSLKDRKNEDRDNIGRSGQ
ncbi:hypothetical protein Godav_006085 [Gossypium davidsonii]|uniref:CCHC-type domain-containing protein n=1 Tax=Gossypium davidsonii TaxID=34287 RepID=A0A7J8S2L8_GOSDV|nr:hypothetical protein [Gossypium davidsonii]